MKFKQQQEEQEEVKVNKTKISEELKKSIVDLIQFEIDKLSLVKSAKYYCYYKGLVKYEKYFAGLYNACEKVKDCLIMFLKSKGCDIPEFTIPEIEKDFENITKPFELLAEKEDKYEEMIISLIDIAFSDKDWVTFNYFLKKLDGIDHICCRALEAVKNNGNVLDLCEQRITEK